MNLFKIISSSFTNLTNHREPSELQNKFYKNSQSGGFIEFFLAIIIAIVMLRLLGIKIEDVLAAPEVRTFAIWLKDLLVLIWHDLLEIIKFIREIVHSS